MVGEVRRDPRPELAELVLAIDAVIAVIAAHRAGAGIVIRVRIPFLRNQ
jgi:hypothetical protein